MEEAEAVSHIMEASEANPTFSGLQDFNFQLLDKDSYEYVILLAPNLKGKCIYRDICTLTSTHLENIKAF